jgi:sugar lactone lactonase YvrE
MACFVRRFWRAMLGAGAALLLSSVVLAHPGSGILVDRRGQIYFIDTGSGLWKIDTQGALSHLSPLRNHWLAMDPNDRFTQTHLPTDPTGDWVITAASSNPTILISTDFPLLVGADGDLYFVRKVENSARLLRTKPTGERSVFVTLPRGATGAAVEWINGIAQGPDGSIYYTEDNAVRRITAKGAISTVAVVPALANGPSIPDVDKRPYLRGLKTDSKGVVYVADTGDARVLKIAPDGKISTLLQLESPWAPTDVAVHGEIVYVLEFLHTPGDDRTAWMPRIRKITPEGKSTIILTVDQMPGARPARSAAARDPFPVGLWAQLIRNIIFV